MSGDISSQEKVAYQSIYYYRPRMFAKRRAIVELRKRLGMSQKKFAEAMGLALPTVRAIEAEKFGVSDRVAERVSFRTGVSAAWLQAGDPKNPVTPRGEEWTIEHFEKTRDFILNHDPLEKLDPSEWADIMYHMAGNGIGKVLVAAYEKDRVREYTAKIYRVINEMLGELGADEEWFDLKVDSSRNTDKTVTVNVGWKSAQDYAEQFRSAMNKVIEKKNALEAAERELEEEALKGPLP